MFDKFLGVLCMKQSKSLPLEKNQVRPPKEGSAAEPLVEFHLWTRLSAAKGAPEGLSAAET